MGGNAMLRIPLLGAGSSAAVAVSCALLLAACSPTGGGPDQRLPGGTPGHDAATGSGGNAGTVGWSSPDAGAGRGGSGAAGTGGSAGTGSGGSAGVGSGGAADSGGAGAANTLRLSMGPIEIPAGQETTLCIDLRMPTTEPFELVKVVSDLTEGGHHLIVYGSSATAEARTPYPCSASADIINPQMLPLFIAQQRHTSVDFPEGVAYQLPAGRMLRIELHFFNALTEPVKAGGTVDFFGADPANVREHSNFMFWGPTTLFILPRSSASVTQFYRFNKATPPNVFGLTTHTHARGKRTTVEFGPDGAGRRIYENTDWAEPPLQLYTPPLVAASANDGLRLTCEYQNNTDATLTFGESAALNEMCFLWAYYYPDQGHDVRVILP